MDERDQEERQDQSGQPGQEGASGQERADPGSSERSGGEPEAERLAREIEEDPSSNPDDELLREVKGG